MYWSAYHVFGSGAAVVEIWVPQDMELGEFIAELAAAKAHRRHDGNDGFNGTYSVPDAVVCELGIRQRRRIRYYPGGAMGDPPPAGYRQLALSQEAWERCRTAPENGWPEGAFGATA